MAPGRRRRHARGVGVEPFEQHVQVAHRAQRRATTRELAHVARLDPGPVGAIEHPPHGAHPPRRDAHLVELLDVLAGTGAGLRREHPGEVHPEHLAARLRRAGRRR